MKELKRLIAKDIFDCLSEEERERLQELCREAGIDGACYDALKQRVTSDALAREIRQARSKTRRMVNWSRWAAILVLPLMVAAYFLFRGEDASLNSSYPVVQQLPAPDRKQPILILGDGSEMSLTRENGEKRVDGNAVNKGEELVYSREQQENLEKQTEETVDYHTVVIPKGGEFCVTLEDGSRMWFNENTRVRYPVAFVGTERDVYLEKGEIFLEVAHDTDRPFIVHTANGDVKVLGTRFDVQVNQANEMIATLEQGKVEVSRDQERVVLAPNQQATVARTISVKEVDVEEVVCWKDNKFYFNDVELGKIMDKLADWYGFTVSYENTKVKDERFFVSLDKYEDGEKILRVLEEVSDVRFQIEGNVVKVKSKN